MTEDIENELRRRLAPIDAPEGFADRVMRALPSDVKPAVITSLPTPRRSWMQQFGMPTALAASLLAAVMLGRYSAEHREQLAEQRGREASRELMQALRLTSDKLDIAYQAVQGPPPADPEENRS
jgi:hypothetical protein